MAPEKRENGEEDFKLISPRVPFHFSLDQRDFDFPFL